MQGVKVARYPVSKEALGAIMGKGGTTRTLIRIYSACKVVVQHNGKDRAVEITYPSEA